MKLDPKDIERIQKNIQDFRGGIIRAGNHVLETLGPIFKKINRGGTMSEQYDFDGWMRNKYPNKSFTPNMYQSLESAYRAGFNRGHEGGYIYGASAGERDLKKALIEAVEEKFSKPNDEFPIDEPNPNINAPKPVTLSEGG